MAHHELKATMDTVQLGAFSATDEAVLTVKSGDTVTMQCLTGWPETTPEDDSEFKVHPLVREINASGRPRLAPHILTGPVAIDGAMPGDTLEVRINKVDYGSDWGFVSTRPEAGTLQDEFNGHSIDYIPFDKKRHVGKLSYGLEIPLAPFFGVMATSPGPNYGRVSSKEPREYGGNMDNKNLTAGSTLFLPVWVPGANFYAGDGHAVQGDGESCVNGLETCLTGEFTFILHADTGMRFPRAETKSHFISMGMHADLDIAMQMALREMIALICSKAGLARDQAYRFCSLGVDFHVTQNVNGEKGVHGMLPKALIGHSL